MEVDFAETPKEAIKFGEVQIHGRVLPKQHLLNIQHLMNKTKVFMLKTSEWVSLGHPDKMADYISCFLLDRYLERDPLTRFAVEVQIKDQFATLGGEITSKAEFSNEDIAAFVRVAVSQIGYTREYQKRWGREHTICGDELEVTVHIGRQSPDIAQGVDRSAWGDQGIFFGMAVKNIDTGHMPSDHALAKKIGEALFNSGIGGLDIKVQVTMESNHVKEVIAAVPVESEELQHKVEDFIRNFVTEDNPQIIVNGTGKYMTHGPVGDCGTTGRKLAVDFYGGNCKIGGGSPWTKDGSKADLALNLYARECALTYLQEHGMDEVHCAISCCIGRREITISYFDGGNRLLATETVESDPEAIINHFRLRSPRFAEMCRRGLFA